MANTNPHKYRWRAFYSDNTSLAEPDVDRSSQPGCETKSAYYDVDHSKLVEFSISDGCNKYGVDLRTGEFLVNNARFRMHSAEEEFQKFNLFWFKRTWMTVGAGGGVVSRRVAFRLGWSSTDPNGKPVQKVLELD